MAEFIEFEAEDISSIENDELDETLIADLMMIDDAEEVENNEPSFYRFVNQTLDPAEAMARVREEQEEALRNLQPCNYLEGEQELEGEFDDEACKTINKDKFLQTLINPVSEQTKENSFFSALLYTINYYFHKSTKEFSEGELKTKIGENLFDKLKIQEKNCILDLDRLNFEDMCFDLNEILLEHQLFLRVYERRDKFRYLFHLTEEKNNTMKTLSCCLQVKFNGFEVAAPYLESVKKRSYFQSI